MALIRKEDLNLKTILRRRLVTGLLISLPLIVTLWITWQVVNGLEGAIHDFFVILEKKGWFDSDYYVFGMGIFLAALLMILVGIIASNVIGTRFIALGESIVARVPLISKIYLTVVQLRDTFVGKKAVFTKVVLVEYPRKGLWCIGFITSEAEGEVQHRTEKAVVNVFIPTTPNPTSGYLIFIPKGDIVGLQMTVEEGMKLVISAGALVPKFEVGEETIQINQPAQMVGTPKTE